MSIKIALAQISSVKGNVGQNISNHLKWIEKASQENADAIFFPELSISGYEPKLVQACALEINNPQLGIFQEKSDLLKTVIGVGVPLKTTVGISIAMMVFQPNQPKIVYQKQYLHTDELPYFVSGVANEIIQIREVNIGLAICYESLLPKHFQSYKNDTIHLYLASVDKPQSNIKRAHNYLSTVAVSNRIHVAMVNAIGSSDDFISAGQSAAWNQDGQLIINTLNNTEGLIYFNL